MGLSIEVKKRALLEPIEIELSTVLDNSDDVCIANLKGEIPDWLAEELACDRLTLYKDRSGHWILESLAD